MITNSQTPGAVSGWIGAVPRGWAVARLSFRYSQQLGKMLCPEAVRAANLHPYLGNKDVKWGRADVSRLSAMAFTPAEQAKFSLKSGDLLVCEGGEVGRTAIWQEEVKPCYFQKAIHRLRPVDPRRDEPRFLFYCMVAAALGGHFESEGNKSTIGHLTGEALRAHRFPFPPLLTQRTIVDFLDRKTAAIDALIEKKQKLLDLLAEKRAALINQAVTKGLDPNVPMKDSGIPWIGEIPAHWEVKRLKFVCELETGHTPSRSEASYWVEEECTIPWVSLNDTKALKESDSISETKYRISKRGMANSSAHLIPAGAVVFTRDATIGLAAIIAKSMAVSQHIIGWVCGPMIDNRYLLRVVDCMRGELDRLTFGATLKTIGMGDVREMVTPTPPRQEQERIVDHLGSTLAALDKAKQLVLSQVQCLQEYRQALITAAVTGQLDISGNTASIPDDLQLTERVAQSTKDEEAA